MPFQSSHPDQATVNPKTGRIDKVFVNLDAVYPNLKDQSLEMSFEELRAARRGWNSKVWTRPGLTLPSKDSVNGQKQKSGISIFQDSQTTEDLSQSIQAKPSLEDNTTQSQGSVEGKGSQNEKPAKTKRFKIREISQETQTSKSG